MYESVTLRVECEESDERYGRFVAEPLERGFGATLGNALRRVLLSSLSGSAVTWVKIDGIQHEFSTVPNMKEDTIEFLLNVKAIRIRRQSQDEGRMFLDVEGVGTVRASDIRPAADFEVVNPDLYLATIDSEDGRLSVEFNVEQGKGYEPAGQSEGLPIGAIPVDAVFTPMRKVNYIIEPTRIGQLTNYERLILELWTDGTISPIEAVSQSAQMLIDNFQLFHDLTRAPAQVGEKQPALPIPLEQYNTPIEQLNLSVRTYNCLKRAGISKAGELLERSDKELLDVRNFGQKALEEVKERLKDMGLLPEQAQDQEEEDRDDGWGEVERDEEEYVEEDL